MTLLLALLIVQPAPDALIDRGYEHFYNLEYPQALAVFEKALAAKPADPERHNHIAQTVLFQMMFRSGALESHLVTGSNPFLRRPKMEPTPQERERFLKAVSAAMDLTGKALERDPDDKDALYARGVAYGFRGTYNFLVTRAWMDSLRDMTESRKLHNRITDLDPSNTDARMAQGVHDYIVGSLPWHYRLLGFLAGFRGDKDSGIRTLELVAGKGDVNRIDARILLGVVYRREGKPERVLPILDDLLKAYPRNFLLLLEQSQIYADLGELSKAMASLDRCERMKQTAAPGFASLPQERIEYARGNLLFWYNEPERAITHLRRATAGASKLDPYSGSMSWLRLGQCLDLTSRHDEARKAFAQAVNQFAGDSEGAKQARRYLNRRYTPDRYFDENPTAPRK